MKVSKHPSLKATLRMTVYMYYFMHHKTQKAFYYCRKYKNNLKNKAHKMTSSNYHIDSPKQKSSTQTQLHFLGNNSVEQPHISNSAKKQPKVEMLKVKKMSLPWIFIEQFFTTKMHFHSKIHTSQNHRVPDPDQKQQKTQNNQTKVDKKLSYTSS
jgi:hypothetical protein